MSDVEQDDLFKMQMQFYHLPAPTALYLHRSNPKCHEDQQSQSSLAALLVEGDSLPI